MSNKTGSFNVGDRGQFYEAVTVETSFQKLQKRSFGGEDVAARPDTDDESWWPVGPLLPGVEELTSDFIKGIDAPESLRIAFLLGGAGNGKSFIARSLGKELGVTASSDSMLAHRLYSANKNGVRIELLNDATIAPSLDYEAHQSVALAYDINCWWKDSERSPVAAFCCVNRGIIIDELRSLNEHANGIDVLAKNIVTWLANPEHDVAANLGATFLEPKLNLGEHYRELNFNLNGRAVRISAISVDACSLLEAEKGSHSRAGDLFNKTLELCVEDAGRRPEACPVRSNVRQLQEHDSRQRWEKVLAHSEIASGRLHSYRDVWGLVSLSILGPRSAAADTSSSFFRHIDDRLHIACNGSSVKERLDALIALSQFRLHNALFRAPIPHGDDALPSYPPTTPAHLGLSLVDPSAWGARDSSTVEEAMQNIALGEKPSQALMACGLLENVWFEFDERLEESIVDYVGSDTCSDILRRRLVSWFGGYLTRLVGVSTGNLGNAEVVELWQKCWVKSAGGKGTLPLKLEKAVRSLVFPQHCKAPDGNVLIPAFAARVEPLRASRIDSTPRLAEIIPHSSIVLEVRRHGGRLTLECTLTGNAEIIGQLVLDFALIREALACRGHQAGQTESTSHIEPRIERCRASSLAAVPVTQRRRVVISGSNLMELH